MGTFLTMESADCHFAIPATFVVQVVKAPLIEVLPNSNETAIGKVYYQGSPFDVVNLKHLANPTWEEYSVDDQLILIQAQERIALMVDRVCDVISLSERRMHTSGKQPSFSAGYYIDGTHTLYVIDPNRITEQDDR